MDRRMLFLLLAIALVFAVPSATEAGQAASGPLLSQALARLSASRDEQRPFDASAWSAVQSIVTGTEVFVATDAHPEARRVFVSASADELLSIRVDGLPADATRALIEALRRDPAAVVSLAGPGFRTDRLSITPDGVVWRGAKIAEFAGILDRSPREHVQVVKSPVHRTNRTIPTVVGALIGGAIGFVSASVIANSDNIGRTRGESLVVVSLIGMPIAGAMLGRWSSMHDEQTVYYVRRN